MTKLSSIPTGAVLVAIDMSKHRQEVLIERPEGGRRRRMTVMATKADYDRLAADLGEIGRPIIVGFEATGNYHRTLAHRLLTAGFELRLISSVALARTREALHNGGDKNDSKDAQVILHMLRIGATQRYVDPLAAGINDLQEMSKTHEAISKAKTQTWHRILTHYLPLYFPEIERFAGNSRSDWFLALLERFPTPVSMTALGQEAFTREAWSLVGRKVSKARLINDIYETACASVALPVDEDSVAITMFRMVIAQARSLIRQRDEMRARMRELALGLDRGDIVEQGSATADYERYDSLEHELSARIDVQMRALGVSDESDLLRLVSDEFPRFFLAEAKRTAQGMLDENEDVARSERERYAGEICTPDRAGLLAADAHLEELDPALADMPIVRKRIDNARLGTVLSNSFGFGGTNATLVFQRLAK